MKNPTIKDIASMCGVSVSTVSRAINDAEGISAKTRAEILKTIKETGYEPDTNARNLKITKNKTIAVLVKGITNPFFTPMIKVIEEEISKTGHSFILNKVEEHSSEVDVALRMVKILKPEGIIFLGGDLRNDKEKLKALGIPYSMTTIINKEIIEKNSICVGVDDYKESYKIVDYLINLGHKKIAFIAARENDISIGSLRFEGYKKALSDHGIDFDENIVIYPPKGLDPYSLYHGYESGKKIVKEALDCTAIFAISDFVAIGAIKAINDMGKLVPEDYSVAGFDGLETNEFLPQPITTIVQPTSQIAYTSVKELFKIIEKEKYKEVTSFDAKLFVGATTARLRGGVNMKKAGILWPLASLNGSHGIGDFGRASYDFIDTSKEAGFDMWQILPLNPLGYGNSPYQPYSSYAGDEVYISLDLLYEDGLLDKRIAPLKQKDRVDYNFVREFKGQYLKKAYEKFKEKELDQTDSYKEFLKFDFVYDYAVFISFKKDNDLIAWNEWPEEQKTWIIDKKLDLSPYQDQIGYEIFIQYIFYQQWMKLKAYANENGLKIIGDIPFYVGLDSLDVWQNQKYFEITDEGKPILIAGVPPDAFSDLGQRWGNPIYRWDELEKDDFKFWIDRLAYNAKLYDIVRLDHFRAFDTYWQIDAKNDTAVEGEWIYAPGFKLFDKITEELKDVEFIAEDLGTMMPGVYKLRDHYDLKGMVIIQENLRPWEDHLIEATANSVAYPGTHDNKTLFQWYDELTEDQQESIKDYFKDLGIDHGDIRDDFFDFVMGTESDYVIVSLADILGLGKEARINEPSTLNDLNWSFKLKDLNDYKEKVEFLNKTIEENKEHKRSQGRKNGKSKPKKHK